MKIYIIEDDISVIGILEDIVERGQLGSICGDNDGGEPSIPRIISADPDLILIDWLMPWSSGIEIIHELREAGYSGAFIMISQVSDKEMIGQAYQAGVEFFIQKPINLIEVRHIISTVEKQLENERTLRVIRQAMGSPASQTSHGSPVSGKYDRERRRLKAILGQLGMGGEKGSADIIDLCIYLRDTDVTVSEMGIRSLCANLTDAPKSMEQRMRRSIEKGISHLASLGLEDYDNEIFRQYSARLFSFSEVRAEMNHRLGKGVKGKVSIKKFLDGLLILLDTE